MIKDDTLSQTSDTECPEEFTSFTLRKLSKPKKARKYRPMMCPVNRYKQKVEKLKELCTNLREGRTKVVQDMTEQCRFTDEKLD